MLIPTKRLAKREFVKQQWTNFIVAWSSSIVRHISLQFQSKFMSSPSWIHGCESLWNNTCVETCLVTSLGSNVGQTGSCRILATTTNR
jgi:hypothetical protein